MFGEIALARGARFDDTAAEPPAAIEEDYK